MKKVCLFCLCFFIFFVSNLVSADGIDANEARCLHLEITEKLIDEADLEVVDTNLKTLVSGKLFYKEPSGYCVPTNDLYLVGLLNNEYPQILSILHGHTPSAKIRKFDGDDILLVFYFAGGNQYILRPYRFNDEEIEIVDSPSFASNVKSIELEGNTILIKNQLHSDSGDFSIETESYRYQEGKFVPIFQ